MDLTIEKMPLEYFGYYSLLTPIIAAYYQADANEKAGALAKKLLISTKTSSIIINPLVMPINGLMQNPY